MAFQTKHNSGSINKLGNDIEAYIEVAKDFSEIIEDMRKSKTRTEIEEAVGTFFTELFNNLSDKKTLYLITSIMYFDNLHPQLAIHEKVMERIKKAILKEQELSKELNNERTLIEKGIFLHRKGNGFLAVQGHENIHLNPAHKGGKLEKEYKLKKLAEKQNREIYYFDAHLKYDLVEIVSSETVKIERTFQRRDSYDTSRVYELHIYPNIIYPDGKKVNGEIKSKLIESGC